LEIVSRWRPWQSITNLLFVCLLFKAEID